MSTNYYGGVGGGSERVMGIEGPNIPSSDSRSSVERRQRNVLGDKE